MKNSILIVLITIFGLSSINSFAQRAKNTEEITIKTSAQCDMCKKRLEKAMAYEKGIISSELNVETADFTIVFKSEKTSVAKIKEAISKTGYDADEVIADKKAHDSLPHCCQKGGHK